MSCVDTLKKKGLKLTPQRKLIVEIVHDTHAHLTAEEIISYVQSGMPGVNKSTIYRTMELLEQAGCVYKSALGDQFIYHHVEESHHHHLVCSKCGKTVDCDEDCFTSAERSLRQKYGFRVDFKHVVMSGLCESCGSKAN